MESTTIFTVIKMMERLPEPVQRQVLDHLRDYIDDLEEEATWDQLVAQSETHLIAAAQQARREIKEGKASPLDFDKK